MTDPRRAMQLFEQAIALEPSQRERFLTTECGDDTDLRTEIDALIRADSDAGDFLERPVAQPGNRVGERLGAYRLIALIGSGGMGTVYKAERADRAFAKPVAIKLLLFDAGDLRTRFALEQRILGALSHPNIASLLDVGQDANGAPYLVMEYVEGQPITRYAHDRELDLRTRVELFCKILDAMQTAHSQLVVHRDIKPGNVLVDTHDEPKLLDFGIAKLLDGSVSVATRTGLGPLTPEYASPEQVRGEPIGTGSDIYSLGVLLYELVTGERPYQIDDTRPASIEHIVCEFDPPRPSTRLPRVRSNERADGNRRDLDAVILKAMEKQPAKRYASCATFAEDLQRWLDGVQVHAREPALGERATRFVRRHRFGVSVATAASLALLAGSAVAVWQAHLAREQANIARLERDREQRINRFLTDMLGAANPADLGRKATVMQVMQRAQQLADKELADDPEAAASAQLTIAQSFRALGDLDQAQSAAEAGLRSAEKNGDHSTIINALTTLGDVYFDKANLPQSRKLFERAHDEAQAFGDADARGLAALELGLLSNEEGDPKTAQRWLNAALIAFPPSAAEKRATTLDSLGYAAYLTGDQEASIRYRRDAIALMQSAFPNGHPVIAAFSVNLATALQHAGCFEESEQLLLKTLPMQIEMFGDHASDVLWTLVTLAGTERHMNRFDDALVHAKRAYDIALTLSDDNDWKAYAFEKYGSTLTEANRAKEALPILEKALVIDKSMLPADHQSIASVESELGLAHSIADRKRSGEPLARAAYDRLREKYGADNDYTVAAKGRLDKILALPEH
ncbi:MAG TPA: serine/threonine-protein kinase [Rudaea sp.]|nr:serine/threonine-protein kinase [Rudaea sp.]